MSCTALPPLRPGRPANAELLARRESIAELSGAAAEPDYVDIGGVSCAIATIATPRARIVHCHGGGYRHGTARGWTAFAERLATATGAEVLVPDYALAPEFPLPAALHEIVAVMMALQDQQSGLPLILAGDSAGAGLALATASVLNRPLPISGMILLSPWLDLRLEADSYRRCAATDSLISQESLAISADAYLQGVPPQDPLASPLLGDLAGLPRLHVEASGDEVLCDDSIALAARLAAAGVPCELIIEPGEPHVWAVPFPERPASVRTLARLKQFVGDIAADMR